MIGRRGYTQSDYIDIARTWVKEYARTKFDDAQFDAYAKKIIYFKMDMTNADDYENVAKLLLLSKIFKIMFTTLQ